MARKLSNWLSDWCAWIYIHFDMSHDYGGQNLYKVVKHKQPGPEFNIIIWHQTFVRGITIWTPKGYLWKCELSGECYPIHAQGSQVVNTWETSHNEWQISIIKLSLSFTNLYWIKGNSNFFLSIYFLFNFFSNQIQTWLKHNRWILSDLWLY